MSCRGIKREVTFHCIFFWLIYCLIVWYVACVLCTLFFTIISCHKFYSIFMANIKTSIISCFVSHFLSQLNHESNFYTQTVKKYFFFFTLTCVIVNTWVTTFYFMSKIILNQKISTELGPKWHFFPSDETMAPSSGITKTLQQ